MFKKSTAVLAILFLDSMAPAKTRPTVIEKIVIVKSTRTMTLSSHDGVVRTYKVALGTEPVGRNRGMATTKRRRATMSLTQGTHIANFTFLCIFLIRMLPTGSVRASLASLLAATS